MDQFLGEIRLLPFNFAPRDWALCQGQLLPIAQNTALFSLLGTQYGGNGVTTFALPDLRGRAAVGMGQGPGLSNYPVGTQAGTENVTLISTEIPAHTHTISNASVPVNAGAATATSPASNFFAKVSPEAYGPGTANGPMAANLLNGPTAGAGGSQPHENRQPFLVLNYCIALQGEFPQRQ